MREEEGREGWTRRERGIKTEGGKERGIDGWRNGGMEGVREK